MILNKLLKFHIKSNKLATVTAVHPPSRFGEIIIKNGKVKEFNEKTTSKSQWINGGFFIVNKKFLKLGFKYNNKIDNDINETINALKGIKNNEM